MVYCSIILPIGYYKSVEGKESLSMSRRESLPAEVANTTRSIQKGEIRPNSFKIIRAGNNKEAQATVTGFYCQGPKWQWNQR